MSLSQVFFFLTCVLLCVCELHFIYPAYVHLFQSLRIFVFINSEKFVVITFCTLPPSSICFMEIISDVIVHMFLLSFSLLSLLIVPGNIFIYSHLCIETDVYCTFLVTCLGRGFMAFRLPLLQRLYSKFYYVSIYFWMGK